VPAIREALTPWTDDPEGFLAQLLSMGPGGYSLEGSDVVYQGGEPCLETGDTV
jgi:hypothetical protein